MGPMDCDVAGVILAQRSVVYHPGLTHSSSDRRLQQFYAVVNEFAWV